MPATIRTIEDAMREFDAMAVTLRRIHEEDAILARLIDEATAETEAKTAADRQEAKAIRDRLLRYIRNHQDQFADPRSVTTRFGSFGVRDSTSLTVEDGREDDLARWLADHACDDCIKPPSRPQIIKDAIRTRLEKGQAIPYCATATTTKAYVEIPDAPHE